VLADARRRLLAPGGVMIPLSDEIWAAPVHAPEEHDRLTRPWRMLGFDLAPGREAVLNEWGRSVNRMDGLLANPLRVTAIDHTRAEARRVGGTGRWVAEKDGTAHGLAAWFRTELAPGIGYATGPLDPPTVYGQAFFPWPEPVELASGDRVEVALSAHFPGGEVVWVWRTTIERPGVPPLRFQQPANLAMVQSPASLRRRGAAHVPGLSERGRAVRAVLDGAAGGGSLDVIADRLLQDFPALFQRKTQALSFAADLMEEHGA
jgi:type I protein arginine methyltransferase